MVCGCGRRGAAPVAQWVALQYLFSVAFVLAGFVFGAWGHGCDGSGLFWRGLAALPSGVWAGLWLLPPAFEHCRAWLPFSMQGTVTIRVCVVRTLLLPAPKRVGMAGRPTFPCITPAACN